MTFTPIRIFRGIVSLPLATAIAYGVMIVSPSAGAQLQDSVLTRPRPAYDALGIQLGGFRLLPAISTGYAYDDNVYLTQTGHEGDSIISVNPKVSLLSQWSRNVLNFYSGLTQFEYVSQYSNNRTDWYIGSVGLLEILRGITLTSNLGIYQMHEPRNSPNDPSFIARPVQFIQDHADTTFTYRPYRIGFDVGAAVDHYNFFSSGIIGGGSYDNRDRDESTYSFFTSAYYEVFEGYSAFVRATRITTQYAQYLDQNGLNRNDAGNQFDSGLKIQVTKVISGEAFLGYLSHDYHDPLPNVNGLDFGAKIVWNITPLMTLHINAGRTVLDTTIYDTAAQDNKAVALALDYELLRNLIILTEVDYIGSTFPGTYRRDSNELATVGARVLINRFLSATLRFTPTWRESNVPGQSYNDSAIGLTLSAQL